MPTQAEIAETMGMPTYDTVDCMNCSYDGHMIRSEMIDGIETCSCPECTFQQPVDGAEVL